MSPGSFCFSAARHPLIKKNELTSALTRRSELFLQQRFCRTLARNSWVIDRRAEAAVV